MFLTLAQAGEYCGGRSARWARRHLLPAIPHYHPPGSGILINIADIDSYLKTHRHEPVELDAVVRDVLRERPRSRKGGRK
jgi:hypothetical protein